MSDERLGIPVPHWTPPSEPLPQMLDGRYVMLERLEWKKHEAALWEAFAGQDGVWDFMPAGPFSDLPAFRAWGQSNERSTDPLFFAIFNKDAGTWQGVASYLRIAPAAGSIEVGYISFSPALQKTRAATEAMYLMMKWAFDAGYRRYEWKCNDLNLASKGAAKRFGFTYEGTFRQALVVKGRNRDTAWFSLLDNEWPEKKLMFERWLEPENFDEHSVQRRTLASFVQP